MKVEIGDKVKILSGHQSINRNRTGIASRHATGGRIVVKIGVAHYAHVLPEFLEVIERGAEK